MPDSACIPALYPDSQLFGLAMLEQAGPITCVAREYTPAPVFALTCGPDAANAETGVEVIFRMMGSRGRVFRSADYGKHGISIECIMAPGLDFVGGHDGRRDYMHLHGRHADLSLALASVAFVVRGENLHDFQFQAIAAERPGLLACRDWYTESLAPELQGYSRGPALAQACVRVSVLGF